MAKLKLKHIASSAIVAGAFVGALTAVPAIAHEGRYVSVLWQFPGYPDLSQPQPYKAASDIINLEAFDELLATPEYCGTGWYQVDIYKTKLEDGTPWETLKASGALEASHDGSFLAYDLDATPYKVIEAPTCAVPTQTPTSSPTPTSTPTSPEPTPSETSTPTPTPSQSTPPATSTPVASPTATVPPVTSTQTPSVPTSSPSRPSAISSSPTSNASSVPVSKPSSTGTGMPTLASPASSELAYTGADGRQQIWGWTLSSLLLGSGIALLFLPRVIKHYRRRSN